MSAFLALMSFTLSLSLSLMALNRESSRRFLFGLIVVFGSSAFRHVSDVFRSTEQAHLACMFLLIFLSHTGYTLCIEDYHSPYKQNVWDWRAAYKMVFNARWIGTTQQTPDVLQRSEHRNNEVIVRSAGRITPSHAIRKFLRRRLTSAATIYLLNRLHHRLVLTQNPVLSHTFDYEDFLPPKQTFFRRIHSVTLRETIIRVWLVLYFNWSAWALYTGLHDIFALMFVGIGLDEPYEWPPLYGSLTEAYSIRRFWAKFWHRLVYRSYNGYAQVVSRDILKLAPRGRIDHFFTNFFVFFMSGMMHVLVSWRLGFRCGQVEELQWFCLNFAGILTEEAFQHLVARTWCFRPSGKGWNTFLRRTVGHLWVFLFLFWSLPKYHYPQMFCLPAGHT